MTDQHDALGEAIIAAGFAANGFDLSLNECLRVPSSFPLDDPWSLPSRLFQFPVRTPTPVAGESRRLLLEHPSLVDHPYVRHVQSTLGVAIVHDPAAELRGGHGLWHHAVDLIIADRWDDLLRTRHFTTDEAIARAIAHGIFYNDGPAAVLHAKARHLLGVLGIDEPASRKDCLSAFMDPSPCAVDGGKPRYPLNYGFGRTGCDAWHLLHALELGWVSRAKHGLVWTDVGRQVHREGVNCPVAAADGQLGFAF